MKEYWENRLEELLEGPYCVIDFLPEQAPEKGGNYFAVEAFYRKSPLREELNGRFLRLLLGLNCFERFVLGELQKDEWTEDPSPEKLEALLSGRFSDPGINLALLLSNGQSALTLYGDDLYMTLYAPSPRLRSLVQKLAASQGLFLRG